MKILKMIEELRNERARIDEALVSLVKLSMNRTPRRGRPPAWSRAAGLPTRRNGNGLANSESVD